MHSHFCYILELIGDPRFNYIGYTVDMTRRIRQHNGDLVGGARITTRKSSIGKFWKVIALVSSEQFTHPRALSCEWWLKHPNGKRKHMSCFSGSMGKIWGLARVLAHHKFADDIFTVWIDPIYNTELSNALKHQEMQRQPMIMALTTIFPSRNQDSTLSGNVNDTSFQNTSLRGGNLKPEPASEGEFSTHAHLCRATSDIDREPPSDPKDINALLLRRLVSRDVKEPTETVETVGDI